MIPFSRRLVVVGLLIDLAGALLLVVPEYPLFQRVVMAREWIDRLRAGRRTLFEEGWLAHDTDGFDEVLSVLTNYVSLGQPPDTLSTETVPRLPNPERVAERLEDTVDSDDEEAWSPNIVAAITFDSTRDVVVANWFKSPNSKGEKLESTTIGREFEEYLESIEEALYRTAPSEESFDDVMNAARQELGGSASFDPFDQSQTRVVFGSTDTITRWIDGYPERYFVRAGAATLVTGFTLQIVGTVLLP